MANPEQLEKLSQGVEIWNEWRQANPDVKVDLNKADFKGADLKSKGKKLMIVFTAIRNRMIVM